MFPFVLKPYLFTRGAAGLCCDVEGVALGPVKLVEKCGAVPGERYRICPPEVFVKAFITAYGRPPFELAEYLWEGLGRVTKSLEEGDVALAMMKAIFLKFPEIESENMMKLEAGEMKKYNLSQDANARGFAELSGAKGAKRMHLADEFENASALQMALSRASEVAKFNPYHDPDNGQFTFAPGGASQSSSIEPSPPAKVSVGKIIINRNKKGGDPRIIAQKLKKLPVDVQLEIEKHHINIIALNDNIGEVDSSGETPRSWPRGAKWADVPGAYDPNTNTLLLATNSNQSTGSVDFMLHETGHAIDHGRGNESSGSVFRAAYAQDSKGITEDYYLQSGNPSGYLEETYAESFAAYYSGDKAYEKLHPNLYKYWKNHKWSDH